MDWDLRQHLVNLVQFGIAVVFSTTDCSVCYSAPKKKVKQQRAAEQLQQLAKPSDFNRSISGRCVVTELCAFNETAFSCE
jgi:hypothetical protein